MPKLRQTEQQKADFKKAMLDVEFRAIYKYRLEKTGYDREQIQNWLGIKQFTYYSRLKHPAMYSYEELRVLFEKLKFTPEEVCRVFGMEIKYCVEKLIEIRNEGSEVHHKISVINAYSPAGIHINYGLKELAESVGATVYAEPYHSLTREYFIHNGVKFFQF